MAVLELHWRTVMFSTRLALKETAATIQYVTHYV